MQSRNAPYMMNPDMVAFTIGRISLHLLRSEGQVSAEGIQAMLRDILKTGTQAGVSPDMAVCALSLLVEENEEEFCAAA